MKNPIKNSIARAQRTVITAGLLISVSTFLAINLSLWLALFYLDNKFALPMAFRLMATVGAFVLMVFLFIRLMINPFINRNNLEKTALHLEKQYNVPENILINALQFERRTEDSDAGEIEKYLAFQTINNGYKFISRVSFGKLWQPARLIRWAIGAVVIIAAWSVYTLMNVHLAANALARYTNPLADVPPVGSVILEVNPEGDIVIAEGDDLIIELKVKSRKGQLNIKNWPEIIYQQDVAHLSAQYDITDRRIHRDTLVPVEGANDTYRYKFQRLRHKLAFRIFVADTYTHNISVDIASAARITDSQYKIQWPQYTGRKPDNLAGPPEPLTILPGSAVAVDIKLDKPTAKLTWVANNIETEFIKENNRWLAKPDMDKAGPFIIKVSSAENRSVPISQGQIVFIQDRTPEIDFNTTNTNMTVVPGQRLRLQLNGSDDFGIKEISVTVAATASSQPRIIKTFEYSKPKVTTTEDYLLSIDPAEFIPGRSYILQAKATDFCPAANTGQSRPILLHVQSLDQLTMPTDDPCYNAFAKLDEVIAAQQKALSITQNIGANIEEFENQNEPAKISSSQFGVQVNGLKDFQSNVGYLLQQVYNLCPTPKPDFARKIETLRNGPHSQTIKGIGNLKNDLDKIAVQENLNLIADQQQYILDQLMAIKGQLAQKSQIQAQQKTAQLLGEEDSIISETPEDKLDNFVTELDDFVDKQKDIMQRRQLLMDQRPEDFSDVNADELAELVMDQSKLAEILDSAVNDFTNMELQDFSDNAMVDKLKTSFAEAEALAEDALEAAQQRNDRIDAYRLETEAVEMAEELMFNCEAILGMYDSIQFIAEIAEDQQLVAPLAELPAELEDLVADLITTEEEMRPEVEDIGSYLNSLDHTAGALMDGTIASTSAKGITGDQKPEDNVIQGRSGSGRSGMSDGQMVESVAKAISDNDYELRQRTSNSPLESGLVEDQDPEAKTGGTGLGKSSDKASAFGTGGKLPPKVLDMMKAVANQQLNLQSNAQQIIPKLKAHNLPTEDLEVSAKAMADFNEALRKGDGVGVRNSYNAAVDSLKSSHEKIQSSIAVRYYRGVKKVNNNKDIKTNANARHYKNYEKMINAYFESAAQK
ncbi:MAG: hypothetical protein JEZ07_04950 [Phycisphaerae bacterium]|nr:hypothetical protein [Phycisphaerae bacterium]